MKTTLAAAAITLAPLLLACSGEDGSGKGGAEVYTGPIRFTPMFWSSGTSPPIAYQINVPVNAGGKERLAKLDTGSIYYFLGKEGDGTTLPCQPPELFSFGSGLAYFCPVEAQLNVQTPQGFTAISDQDVLMGNAEFKDWGGPPYGIMGLSANLTAENKAGMQPITTQLNPEFLSFSFPGGLDAPGWMQFATLEHIDPTAVQIPLVPVPSIGYGYTAELVRLEYLDGGRVTSAIVQGPDGVYYERDGAKTRIASQLLAFFDTGAPAPVNWLNGDISLLADDVASDNITPSTRAPAVKAFNAVFLDTHGNEAVIPSGKSIEIWELNELTPGVVPAELDVMCAVLGLNFIANFDFQFAFDSGAAVTVTFVKR